jgi:hypothetical protein
VIHFRTPFYADDLPSPRGSSVQNLPLDEVTRNARAWIWWLDIVEYPKRPEAEMWVGIGTIIAALALAVPAVWGILLLLFTNDELFPKLGGLLLIFGPSALLYLALRKPPRCRNLIGRALVWQDGEIVMYMSGLGPPATPEQIAAEGGARAWFDQLRFVEEWSVPDTTPIRVELQEAARYFHGRTHMHDLAFMHEGERHLVARSGDHLEKIEALQFKVKTFLAGVTAAKVGPQGTATAAAQKRRRKGVAK